jgi:hypothetical protein
MNLDNFEKDVLRRTIFGFYDGEEFPAEKKLALELRDKINYRGSVSSVYKILKSIGFKYRKISDGRKFLVERGDIVAARIKFLWTVHNLRITGDERPEFYFDETWVEQNHSKKYIWQDSSRKEGLRVPPGKGLLCATQDQQKRALFLTASGSFAHVHKCEVPIIIRR